MPSNTPRLALPYPVPDDSVDVPRDVQALATKLDNAATDAQGTLAARPAAGTVGRYYLATDTGLLYRDSGTTWVVVGGNPPTTQVTKAGNQVPQSSLPFLFDTVAWDTVGMWNAAANDRLTIKVPGLYLLSGQVGSNGATVATIYAQVNGAPFGAGVVMGMATGGGTYSFEGPAKLAAGDYIQFRVNHAGASFSDPKFTALYHSAG